MNIRMSSVRSGISLLVLCLLSTVGVGRANAAPSIGSISGTVSNGNTVTVSGSGFGTHADWGGSQTFLNKAWHNFENGSFTGGNIDMGSFPEGWRMMTTGNRTNSTHYAERFAWGGTNSELGSLEVSQSGSPLEYYISFWFKTAPSNQQAGKFLRIWGANYNVYYSTGGGDTYVRAYCEGCGGGTQWDSATQFGLGIWRHFELYMNTTTLEHKAYIDGVEQWSRPDLTHSNWGGNGHTIDIGHMIDDRGDGNLGWYDYDDVYIDHTQARVELCQNSIRSSRGTCEVQIPTAWSASSLTVTANPASFTSGTTAYLYVIDSAGTVNTNGYPVTIGGGGGGGDTTPPTSPTNLAANATSSSSVTVSWTASTDNIGVTGYIVERCQGTGCSNFTQVGTPTASPFVDSGLTANTLYNYHVRATDAAGNLSTTILLTPQSLRLPPKRHLRFRRI